MKKISIFIIVFIAAIQQAVSGGLIIIGPPGGGRIANPNMDFYMLESKNIKIETEINGRNAVTNVTQVFSNPSNMRLEGHFLFPAPRESVIDKFSMDINGTQTPAELLSANEAREIYENIVRQMKDPALLEYSGRGLFKARIFPIEPNSEKTIIIRYSEALPKENNTLEYIFPLNTKKHSAKPLKNLSMKISIKSGEGLKTIFSPTHDLEIIRKGANEAVAGMEEKEVKPETDFRLLIGCGGDKFGMAAVSYKEANDDGFFMLDITPGYISAGEISEKDVTFVMDVSGSMAGEKMNQAKKALQYCVNSLRPGDKFEIVKFSTEAAALFGSRRKADKGNIREALDYIESLRPIGGTNIDEALSLALKEKPESGRPFIVIFLTDGKPTIGETNIDKLVENVKQNNSRDTRIFTFGAGYDVNTKLLDRITEETRAFRTYIAPGEDIEAEISEFFEKAGSPALSDIEIDIKGIKAYEAFPKKIPDLFKNSSINILGRYKNDGNVKVSLKGKVNGKAKSFDFRAEFKGLNANSAYLGPIWASRKIGYLLDQIRINGESKEVVTEVTLLAKRYGIITPYTSYLILEDERVNLAARLIPEDRVIFNNRARDDGDFISDNEAFYREMQEESGQSAIMGSKGAQKLNNAGNLAQLSVDKSKMEYIDKKGNRQNFASQSRMALGRAFYQNGDRWMGQRIQQNGMPAPVKIKFASEDYFSFISENPESAQILALGRNLIFEYGGRIYEIYD